MGPVLASWGWVHMQASTSTQSVNKVPVRLQAVRLLTHEYKNCTPAEARAVALLGSTGERKTQRQEHFILHYYCCSGRRALPTPSQYIASEPSKASPLHTCVRAECSCFQRSAGKFDSSSTALTAMILLSVTSVDATASSTRTFLALCVCFTI